MEGSESDVIALHWVFDRFPLSSQIAATSHSSTSEAISSSSPPPPSPRFSADSARSHNISWETEFFLFVLQRWVYRISIRSNGAKFESDG
jgi:hypothetical protein